MSTEEKIKIILEKERKAVLEMIHFYLPLFRRGTYCPTKILIEAIDIAIKLELTYEDMKISLLEIDFYISGGSERMRFLKILEGNYLPQLGYEKHGLMTSNIEITEENIEKINKAYSITHPPIDPEKLFEIENILESIFSKPKAETTEEQTSSVNQ